MTLASETMSSILQSPQSSNAVSSKSKLGFSIDSIVGAKSVFRSASPPSPSSQKLRDSLTSLVSPTDLSLRGSPLFDPRDSRQGLHPFGLLSASPRPGDHASSASINFQRMAAAAMAVAAAAGGAAGNGGSPTTRGRSRSRSRSPSDLDHRHRRFSTSPSPPPSSQPRASSTSPNPTSTSSQAATSPRPPSPTHHHPSSLVRPIPTNGGGLSANPNNPNGGHPLAQSYLDHLANLKAFYDQSAALSAAASSASSGGTTTCSISQGPPPAPHPTMGGHMGHLGGPLGPLGIPRPPGLGHPGIPPLFLAGGGPGSAMPPQIPREYPLYPWFISRRFPGGERLLLLLLLLILFFANSKTKQNRTIRIYFLRRFRNPCKNFAVDYFLIWPKR